MLVQPAQMIKTYQSPNKVKKTKPREGEALDSKYYGCLRNFRCFIMLGIYINFS
jgi:hypothetical protein